MLTLTEEDVRVAIAQALQGEPDTRFDPRLLAAVSHGLLSPDDLGPFDDARMEAMRLAFVASPTTALADLEQADDSWPWALQLEALTVQLETALTDVEVRGPLLGYVARIDAELATEVALEDEAFLQLSALRGTRDQLESQRAFTSKLMSLLPEVV